MDVNQFDFDLPPESIALRPAVPRESARLLVIDEEGHHDKHIRDLAVLLSPNDVLVFNDTRVIPAQLEGRRLARAAGGGSGAKIVITLLKPHVDGASWGAFVKPAKRLQPGDRIDFAEGLSCEVIRGPEAGAATLRFSETGAALHLKLHKVGLPPLPPYISSKRAIDAQDIKDYQTIFATHEGSVAAPTAGLHFTRAVLRDLADRGIDEARVTLHVGAGTFLPVKAEDTQDHVMHAEWGEITDDVATYLNEAKKAGKRIIAVGTTALRLLESAADDKGVLHPFEAETDIFITPGYRFRFIDGLMTNFHLPKSTLFMLVSAFAGLNTMKAAYQHAVKTGYRFYSYGDACLLLKKAEGA
ncbi:MAG: tRNA preQ1(34) S-adenosylmethionine ribosyltransferase-isomerase QueA [Alphaproteobacteria bacterium]|nr:MAG: tRNA preQ1(34) S-adenosylmethionine ribosyltransferase-isomerase QueA [Alphaproteobacteria bacterium]